MSLVLKAGQNLKEEQGAFLMLSLLKIEFFLGGRN